MFSLKFVYKERSKMVRRRAGNARREVCRHDFVCHEHTIFVTALNPVSDIYSVGLFMSFMIESLNLANISNFFSVII